MQFAVSGLLSLTIILGIVNLCLYFIIYYSPKRIINKLTMRPYYWLMVYSLTFSLQLFFSITLPSSKATTIIVSNINSFKTNSQTLVIVTQTYEWFCYWNMICFQSKHDMTTVEVELRKFKPIEQRNHFFYKVTVLFTVITSITVNFIVGLA